MQRGHGKESDYATVAACYESRSDVFDAALPRQTEVYFVAGASILQRIGLTESREKGTPSALPVINVRKRLVTTTIMEELTRILQQ